jgi:diguanylate cyclase (GGDEF)-like protein
LLLDIDHFKRINDTLGHLAGDQVIREVAARCRRTIRSEDVLCRIGGEEFAVIARSTPWRNALILGQRLRRAVCDTTTRNSDREIAISVSVGVAGMQEGGGASAGALFAAADAMLYEAKHAGRNTVRGPER